MNKYNSIKLVQNGATPTLSYVLMSGTFTLSLFFNVFLYGFYDGINIFILLINGLFLFLYIFVHLFFKNALQVLSKEFIGLILFLMPYILSFFYFGQELFGGFKFLIYFFIIYILIDFTIFVKKNKLSISRIIYESIQGLDFDYAVKEKEESKLSLSRSFLGNTVMLFFCLFVPLGLIFGKSLPYVFFGLFSGMDSDYLLIGCFVLTSLIAFLGLNYIYLFTLYLYYFFKKINLEKNKI